MINFTSLILVLILGVLDVFGTPGRLSSSSADNVGKSRKLFEDFTKQKNQTALQQLPPIKGSKFMVPTFMKQNKTKLPDMKLKMERFLDYDSDDQNKNQSFLIHQNHKHNSIKGFKSLREFIPTYKLKMKKKKIEMYKKNTLAEHLKKLEKLKLSMGNESKNNKHSGFKKSYKYESLKPAVTPHSKISKKEENEFEGLMEKDALDCFNTDCDKDE